jgi:hypothetical protein
LAREVLRLRGTLSREEPWGVMVDMFFYRDPEEVEKEAEVVAAEKPPYEAYDGETNWNQHDTQSGWDASGTTSIGGVNPEIVAAATANAGASNWDVPDTTGGGSWGDHDTTTTNTTTVIETTQTENPIVTTTTTTTTTTEPGDWSAEANTTGTDGWNPEAPSADWAAETAQETETSTGWD